MKAEEAKKITASAVSSLEEIFDAIRRDAKLGRNYIDIRRTRISEETKQQLKELGYSISLDGNWYNITW